MFNRLAKISVISFFTLFIFSCSSQDDISNPVLIIGDIQRTSLGTKFSGYFNNLDDVEIESCGFVISKYEDAVVIQTLYLELPVSNGSYSQVTNIERKSESYYARSFVDTNTGVYYSNSIRFYISSDSEITVTEWN